jgi:hypothetical protein
MGELKGEAAWADFVARADAAAMNPDAAAPPPLVRRQNLAATHAALKTCARCLATLDDGSLVNPLDLPITDPASSVTRGHYYLLCWPCFREFPSLTPEESVEFRKAIQRNILLDQAKSEDTA